MLFQFLDTIEANVYNILIFTIAKKAEILRATAEKVRLQTQMVGIWSLWTAQNISCQLANVFLTCKNARYGRYTDK